MHESLNIMPYKQDKQLNLKLKQACGSLYIHLRVLYFHIELFSVFLAELTGVVRYPWNKLCHP